MIRYERDATDNIVCKWGQSTSEQVSYYDPALRSLLTNEAEMQLAFGILECERGTNAVPSWSAGFQATPCAQAQQANRPSADTANRDHLRRQPSIKTTKSYRKGSFLGFVLGRVMAESTADELLNTSETVAQALQLSGRLFHFTAQPATSGSQNSGLESIHSKHIAVLFHDSVEANPLAHAHDFRLLCPTTGGVMYTPAAGPNAAYLPLSYNPTGDVYLAMIAERDIAAGEVVTVDKGAVKISTPAATILSVVLSRADSIRLREAIANSPQAQAPQQQQQQQQQPIEEAQPPSVSLLQQQLAAAVATCQQLTAGASSSLASCRSDILSHLQQAMEASTRLPMAAAAAAGTGATTGVVDPSTPAVPRHAPPPPPPPGSRQNSRIQAMPEVVVNAYQQQPQGRVSITQGSTESAGAGGVAHELPHAAAAAAQPPPGQAVQQQVASLSAAATGAAAGIGQAGTDAGSGGWCRISDRVAAKRASTAAHSSQALPGASQPGPAEPGPRAAKRSRTVSGSRQQVPATQQQQQAASSLAQTVQELSSQNRECQRSAVISLLNLTTNIGQCDAIIAAGAVPLLVDILANSSTSSSDSSSTIELQTTAADVLFNLICNSEGRTLTVIGAAGSIEAVVQLLHSHDQGLLVAAAELLDFMTMQRSCHTAVISAGAVPLLQQHLTSSNSRLQLVAASILADLASSNPAAVSLLMLQQAAAAAVQYLDSKAKRTQQAAVQVVARLACANPHTGALTAAVPRVIKLLSSSSSNGGCTTLQMSLAEILLDLCRNGSNLDAIAAANGLEVLTQHLGRVEDTAASTQFAVHAVDTVYNLVNNHQERQHAAVVAGIIPVVVKLLRHNNILVQRGAAAVLWCIGENSRLLPTVQAAVLKQAAVPILVSLFGSSDLEAQHNAAGALMVLASNSAAIRSAAAAAGAITPLVKMLSSSDKDMQEEAAGALESLAVDSPRNQAAITAVPGAVEQLSVLSTSSVVTVVQKANAVLLLLTAVLPS